MNLTKKISTIIVMCAVLLPITIGLVIFSPKVAEHEVAEYTLEVTSRPKSMLETGMVRIIPGQKCVFLLSIIEEGSGEGYGEGANLSATCSECTIEITPAIITSEQVAELSFIVDNTSIGKEITVNITAERRDFQQFRSAVIEVLNGTDGIKDEALEKFGFFTPWIGSLKSEVDITPETELYPTIVNPRILVVSHYMFVSENWEIYLTWHVAIPEHAWARIYLRHRFTEITPSIGFEIESYFNPGQPYEIEVSDWV